MRWATIGVMAAALAGCNESGGSKTATPTNPGPGIVLEDPLSFWPLDADLAYSYAEGEVDEPLISVHYDYGSVQWGTDAWGLVHSEVSSHISDDDRDGDYFEEQTLECGLVGDGVEWHAQTVTLWKIRRHTIFAGTWDEGRWRREELWESITFWGSEGYYLMLFSNPRMPAGSGGELAWIMVDRRVVTVDGPDHINLEPVTTETETSQTFHDITVYSTAGKEPVSIDTPTGTYDDCRTFSFGWSSRGDGLQGYHGQFYLVRGLGIVAWHYMDRWMVLKSHNVAR